MADWSDIANLWWLKPRNPQGQSSLPAFALGARMQQDRIENDMREKQFILNQQYRTDQLAAQDRLTDLRLQEYQMKAKERLDEEEDFKAMTPAFSAVAQGKDFVPPILKSYNGQRAFDAGLNAIAHQRTIKQASAAEKANNLELTKMATYVINNAKVNGVPQKEAIMASEILKATNNGTEWDPESRANIELMYQNVFKPAPGLVPKSVTQKGGTVTTTYGTPTEEKSPTSVRELEAARDLEDQAIQAESDGNTDEAARLWGDAAALRSKVAPIARVPRSEQDIIDNYVRDEKRRIAKANEGIPVGSKKYIVKSDEQITTEAKAYSENLKKALGAPPTSSVTANERVRVTDPQGRAGTIPRSQLDAALKAGYKQVQ